MDESSPPTSDETASAELPPPPHRPVREDRAARVFLLIGALGAFAILVGLAASSDVPMLDRLVLLIPEVLWVIGLFAAAAGLGARRPWALGSLTVLLVLIFIDGAVAAVQSLSVGRLFVPIGAVLVIWVFRAVPRVPNPAWGGIRATALTAVIVLASVGPWLADLALAPGGPLRVGAADIVPVLKVDCGAPGAGVPATVTASFEWSWNRTEVLPDGIDAVAVGWSGLDDAGNNLFVLGDTGDSSGELAVFPGGGSPSDNLADEFVGRFGGFGGWTWGVDLAEQRMASGQVHFSMTRASSGPIAHGQVTVQAAYVHLAKWINKDAMATCSW